MRPAEKRKPDEYIDKLFQNLHSLSLKDKIRFYELWEEAIKIGLYDGLHPRPVFNWVSKQKKWLLIQEGYQEMKDHPEAIAILSKKYGYTLTILEQIGLYVDLYENFHPIFLKKHLYIFFSVFVRFCRIL